MKIPDIRCSLSSSNENGEDVWIIVEKTSKSLWKLLSNHLPLSEAKLFVAGRVITSKEEFLHIWKSVHGSPYSTFEIRLLTERIGGKYDHEVSWRATVAPTGKGLNWAVDGLRLALCEIHSDDKKVEEVLRRFGAELVNEKVFDSVEVLS